MTTTTIDRPAIPPAVNAPTRVPIGRSNSGTVEIDLGKLLAGRCLIQGSSGAGKSATLRRIIEEAFDFVTVMLVDPEGEFHGLARHIGATTIMAADLSRDGLTAAAARGRQHRVALHVDLTDLEPDERIAKAAAFFSGLIGVPREHWTNTVLVAIDEAHLLAPHIAASAQDAATRKLGVATLTDLCARGRKRGIGTIIATQRLAKLAASVVSELHNHLIGLNVFDRDVARAADLLGFSSDAASQLRRLAPGEFYAFGPAIAPIPRLTIIDPTVTVHTGHTPHLLGAADLDPDAAARALDLGDLAELRDRRTSQTATRTRGLDTFLLEPAATTATRIVASLQRIAPNATTAEDLARHLAVEAPEIDAALDLLSNIGAIDTMPKASGRIARLGARLRLRAMPTPVIGLS